MIRASAASAIRTAWKLALVAVPIAVVLAWFREVEPHGAWYARNTLPPLIVLGLSAWTLWRGNGRWTANGWRMPLGILGFAIPALGLSIYLHYAYLVNLDGLFDGGAGEFFRFLPVYIAGAGLIGLVIGWIVGRNVK